ncbi:MAG: hypothetical protein V3V85_04580 [Candidatus Thorarchaeota archaeon]
MDLTVAIEHDNTGIWYGRFIDYLGTHARAHGRLVLLDRLEQELQYHLDWLRRHDEDVAEIAEAKIVIGEELAGIRKLGESGGEVAFFEFDRRKVTQLSLEKAIRLMRHSRRDLQELIVDIRPQMMLMVLPHKKRNILDILSHVCNAEEFYVSRLGLDADTAYKRNVGMTESEIQELPIVDRLGVVRTACVETLREMVPLVSGKCFARSEYTSYPDELWSAHKVLRRFLEHEREHFYNIRGYLGIPIRNPIETS